MKTVCTLLLLLLLNLNVLSQNNAPNSSTVNIRLSFLIVPFTPLLTLEFATFKKLTIQAETNFINTHGINFKYYVKERMERHYLFIGSAFLQDEYLRKDSRPTILPYVGYGYGHRFGKTKQWTFDSRIGIGSTINADTNVFFPVVKTGIGRVF